MPTQSWSVPGSGYAPNRWRRSGSSRWRTRRGLGDFVETDATGETAVPGLYAAGNVTDPSQQVLQAAAERQPGRRHDQLQPRPRRRPGGRPATSADEADWDHRYGGEQMWSGNPNGTLVNEISGLAPGRALDVGAGEGGDALWLAEQGWDVTASDISQRALDRVDAEAESPRAHRSSAIMCDANALDAFETEAFDLVSAQYASIPRTPDDRGIGNILNAVVPGGTLLVVSHDLEPMRAPIDTRAQSRPFDPDAYVRTEDFAAALADSSEWDIEVHEKRPRPPGRRLRFAPRRRCRAAGPAARRLTRTDSAGPRNLALLGRREERSQGLDGKRVTGCLSWH